MNIITAHEIKKRNKKVFNDHSSLCRQRLYFISKIYMLLFNKSNYLLHVKNSNRFATMGSRMGVNINRMMRKSKKTQSHFRVLTNLIWNDKNNNWIVCKSCELEIIIQLCCANTNIRKLIFGMLREKTVKPTNFCLVSSKPK